MRIKNAEGFSSEKGYSLCRHLVYQLWIALIFNQIFWTFRELTSIMCWSAMPVTAWRRCLTPSYPDMLPVDTKRYLRFFFLEGLHLTKNTWKETDKVCCCRQVVTPVVWNKPDLETSVPLWIIILAILAGLLLLALLIYVLYKVSAAVNNDWKTIDIVNLLDICSILICSFLI